MPHPASRLRYVDNRTNNGQHKYAYTYDKVGNRQDMTVTDSGGTKIHVYTYDDSGNMTHDGTYTYDYDPENRLIRVTKSGSPPTPTLGQALDSGLTYTTDGADVWAVTYSESYQGAYSARSGWIGDLEESYLQTQVEGPGTVTFWWKVSSEEGCDDLEFWIDSTRQDWISGSVDWQEKTFTVSGTGTHTLKWRYVKDGSVSTGDDCGWVDWVQWSGPCPPVPEPAADNWTTLLYRYDAAGRRIEKQYNDETITKYVYDGDHCIAEYDVSNILRRKYIYGPGVDQPVAMIEAAGSYAGTYYYHCDGLGSVVGLTNASGNTVEVYEYDVYGRLGASDASHPNRLLFTGREYDQETGLYYYRARYYNPQIGRFLQTDPVGYSNGMNWYAYCGNDPTTRCDPSGLAWEDCSIRIVLYNGSAEGDPDLGVATGEDLARAAKDPYFDLAIDIGPDGTALKDLCTGTALLDKIMEMVPIDPISGCRIFDRTQVTIEGLWIFDHGNCYGDDSNPVCPETSEFTNLFGDLGAALDNCGAYGTPIHLRGCNTANTYDWGGTFPCSVIQAAATASGHLVSGAVGPVYWDNGPTWRDDSDDGPKYYCPGGYLIATPTGEPCNPDLSPSVSSYSPRGYEWVYDKNYSRRRMPDNPSKHRVWQIGNRVY
ncbi:MAG: hypothetical protein M1376_08210 [Planctomycetes bacterium]|nr:hypothetical protein [Planctomycetota bacterium]